MALLPTLHHVFSYLFFHFGRQQVREYRNYLGILKLFLRTRCIYLKLGGQ